MDVEPVRPKRTYTKKAKIIEEHESKNEIIEEIKPKRAYTKKIKVVEDVKHEEEIKPKRVYIKKTKTIVEEIKQPIIEENQSSIVEEIKEPIIEEPKPKKIYIKKSKIIENNANISNNINTEIQIIQEKLDKLTIEEGNIKNIDTQYIDTPHTDILNNNNNTDVENTNVENTNVENNKRKNYYDLDNNQDNDFKKQSLYTYNIDEKLNLYIYDNFHDGTRLNKNSVLQISYFISTHINYLDNYIIKSCYIKSNNNDIKVCYLGNKFNINLIKSKQNYDFNTKLFIDNKTYKNVYEELKSLCSKNSIDIIYFKKYILNICFYDIYMNIW